MDHQQRAGIHGILNQMEKSGDLRKISCTNAVSGEIEQVDFAGAENIREAAGNAAIYIGPGLVDLQINGINGIDFNDVNLEPDNLLVAADYLLKRGVVSFLPTAITNSEEALVKILSTIDAACRQHITLRQSIAGIHLEGPFISEKEGARGAHDPAFTCNPDWEYFQRLQQASGNRIRLITLAPEREGSEKFIRQCKAAGVSVAVGHSLADANTLEMAVGAGAGMSTHLGNGVPLMLPRHNDILWGQLAEQKLSAGFIGDGFHIPPAFIKVLLRMKGENAILVSDATCFAGMPPGEYQSHIGNEINLDKNGRLSLKAQPGILAGSAADLLQSIEWLTQNKVCTLREAWACASTHAAAYLGITIKERIIFYWKDKYIQVAGVV